MYFSITDKAKLSVILLVIISAAFAAGLPVTADTLSKERIERDSAGREWRLQEWEKGARPYPKDLKEREALYWQKWGENSYGQRNSRRIHNIGDWKWEVVVTVPPELAAKIKSKRLHSGKPRLWGNRFWGMVFVWAPGGGQVTDIYALTDNGLYHYDPVNKVNTFIGSPEEGGRRDGVMSSARLNPGNAATIDPVTGRLYFIQGSSWRYVEKLLPFVCTKTGETCYLPALLGWNNLYQKVKSPFGGELRPAIKGSKHGEAVFVVRTNQAMKALNLPGASRGKRPLITPDSKAVYLAQSGASGREWDTLTLYDKTALFDIETGKMLSKLKLSETVPQNFRSGTDGPGTHGGNCMGYDGQIYTCQHGGSGGGPGRMFSIDPDTGNVTMLYNSIAEGQQWGKRKGPLIDGPADALSLDFTSTLWQVQCPRTGAIINGGWDNSGIRRYHDGFVTSIVNGDEDGRPPRPGWVSPPKFNHGNSSPAIATDGSLYIADDNSDKARIFRIYRTDWPKEQPVNGYAEKFISKEKMEELMLDYAKKYIEHYEKNNGIIEAGKSSR